MPGIAGQVFEMAPNSDSEFWLSDRLREGTEAREAGRGGVRGYKVRRGAKS